MADSIEVKSPDLQRLARELKELGDKDLKKRVMAAIRAEAKPLAPEVVHEGSATLPASGGLRSRIERSRATVYVSGNSVALRFKALAGYERGIIRHPVFGQRDVFVSQHTQAGRFSAAFARRSGSVREGVERAVQDGLNEVARKV